MFVFCFSLDEGDFEDEIRALKWRVPFEWVENGEHLSSLSWNLFDSGREGVSTRDTKCKFEALN